MKKYLLIPLFLFLLSSPIKSTEDFTLVCDGLTHDTFYTFKSSEVAITEVVNKVGFDLNKLAKILAKKNENEPVIDNKDSYDVFPIIESTEGFIKFGGPLGTIVKGTLLPTGTTGEESYFLNRAELTVTSIMTLYNPDGSLLDLMGLDNPLVTTYNCKKPST